MNETQTKYYIAPAQTNNYITKIDKKLYLTPLQNQ